MSAANPRGLILLRDELVGWIAGMDRFTNAAGSDRTFYLQGFGGRLWAPDRVKDGDAEIYVPHLLWSILGTIQPDRLARVVMGGDDDGLAARFIYVWPAPRKTRRPPAGATLPPIKNWLARLRDLPWEPPEPNDLEFEEAGRVALQEWREEVAGLEEDASGLFLSWLGKLPGFAVRLAVILAHMEWCCAVLPGAPPAIIREVDIVRAITFLAYYAVPMARRAFGEAALPEAERDARKLARWLVKRTPIPAMVNAREMRRMSNGPGIPTAARITAALEELAELGLVRRAPPRLGGGRSRDDWLVNPHLGQAPA